MLINRTNWQEHIWKLIRNPTLEVVAAIVVVLLATWLLVNSEVEDLPHARVVREEVATKL